MTDSLLVLPGSVIAGRDELREGFGEDDRLVARPTWPLDVTSSEKDLVKMTDSLLFLPGSIVAGRDELREGFGEDDGIIARPTWLRHRWT
jgi:hypothetical protein